MITLPSITVAPSINVAVVTQTAIAVSVGGPSSALNGLLGHPA